MTFPSEQFAINLNVSCTKDDAIAKLLGWLKGAIHHDLIEIDTNCITLEQLEYMDTLYFSLEKHLTLLRKNAMVEASELVDAGAEKVLIDAQLEQVLDIEDLIAKAKSYILDFDEELEKHTLSMLQIDYTATNKAGQIHIKLKSLDAWARKQYGIYIYGGNENSNGEPARKVGKMIQQQNIIIEDIKKLNLDPKQFPKNEDGISGMKARIRTGLLKTPLFGSIKVFDNAWERLRKIGDTADMK